MSEELDRLAEQQQVKPISSIDDLRGDEEIDADDFFLFLEAIKSARRVIQTINPDDHLL